MQFLQSEAPSAHTARFGEIEQRGIALTAKGRALYDRLLSEVRQIITPAADGHNADAYIGALQEGFAEMPDNWQMLHDQKLAYFRYERPNEAQRALGPNQADMVMVEGHELVISPIIYEDFLPVSAAGIFQSNLGDAQTDTQHAKASKEAFETALGIAVLDEFALYQAIQDESLKQALSNA